MSIMCQLAPEYMDTLIKECRELRKTKRKPRKEQRVEGIDEEWIEFFLEEDFVPSGRRTGANVFQPARQPRRRQPPPPRQPVMPTTDLANYFSEE